MTNDELNKNLAELRGWKCDEFGTWYDSGHEMMGDLPDIAGDDCAALEAAQWICKERGLACVISLNLSGAAQVEFHPFMQESEHDWGAVQDKLSLAIALAMVKAMEAK
jgi:hypothetical protein